MVAFGRGFSASLDFRLLNNTLFHEARHTCTYTVVGTFDLHLGRCTKKLPMQQSLLLEVRVLPKIEGVAVTYLEGRLKSNIYNCRV